METVLFWGIHFGALLLWGAIIRDIWLKHKAKGGQNKTQTCI